MMSMADSDKERQEYIRKSREYDEEKRRKAGLESPEYKAYDPTKKEEKEDVSSKFANVRSRLDGVGTRIKESFRASGEKAKQGIDYKIREKTGKLTHEESQKKLQNLKDKRAILKEQAEIERIKSQRQKVKQARRSWRDDSILSGGSSMDASEWFGMSQGKSESGGMSFNLDTYNEVFNSGFGNQKKNSKSGWSGNIMDIGGPASKGMSPPDLGTLRKFYGIEK